MTKPIKHRAKTDVEAMQWDGTDTSAAAIQEWATVPYERRILYRFTFLQIETPSSDLRAYPGDWVIKDATDHVHVIGPDKFEQAYEATS